MIRISITRLKHVNETVQQLADDAINDKNLDYEIET